MRFPYLVIIILILILGISGCAQKKLDQSDDSLYPLNNTNNSLEVPENSTTNNETVNNSKDSDRSNIEVRGKCYKVVDGDTIDVEGVGRVRFVGVNTPERGEPGYKSAKDFVKKRCLGKTVGLDIDDYKNRDKYHRTLAVVYVDGIKLNQELLNKGDAAMMYMPPSEYKSSIWP